MTTQTIFATFEQPEQAERAIGALVDHGVSAEDINLVVHEDYFVDSESGGFPQAKHDQAVKGITTTTPGDAAAGAEVGAGIGLGLGVLAAAATVFIPGVGIVIGGGALAAALGGVAGSAAAGAVAGGLTGYLKDQGVQDTTIERYHSSLAESGAFLAVTCPSNGVDARKIEAVLAKYDGSDVGAYSRGREGVRSHGGY